MIQSGLGGYYDLNVFEFYIHDDFGNLVVITGPMWGQRYHSTFT